MKHNFKTSHKKIIADMLTPVSIYLRLRAKYKNCILLESSDYHGDEHNFSYICFQPIAGFKVESDKFIINLPDRNSEIISLKENKLCDLISDFISKFSNFSYSELPIITNGLFGYMTYDVVQYFEDIQLNKPAPAIPIAQYFCYQYIIAFNHFNQELFIIKNEIEQVTNDTSTLDDIESFIKYKPLQLDTFACDAEKTSNLNDAEYLEMVNKGKQSCYRGDVFQIVLSRQFQQNYRGDDFNVYRALRSVNPSPYCFYFDLESFRLMGSSPESQFIIKNNKVTIHPIAGTFRRTGDDVKDAALAKKLADDPKENAEHIMLVDLARNDLSRGGKNTTVEVYREVQYYSHVIHLVSKVTSEIDENANKIKMIGDTFPAGTLSGAPKYKAMQLIDNYEKTSRSFYGGCIGHLNFNGDFNHAIMIRSFLSKDNTLTFQAGAGVVADSVPESELQEVENKLAALNKAIALANTL
ncbi:MAG TPA: chorismate-binding protein [Chitinophagales bacterium]|nr:chorismate-binding protein [Chitinophagales bacterium]HNC70726.1 chorismate-binding protein [Chitinophagales bacterium]HND82856.1 chorismate-binding protein [Chitinophagales bacterium]HNF18124.1 chorismate-binding protein [Chitinophagales bacterium]HNF51246.1 chorismate-binding protein [Chitinophagales bacterium]